tara:strand:+ start:2365 stop:3093 length:729 start_codon:yes stop_codon:yes gene_type:complete
MDQVNSQNPELSLDKLLEEFFNGPQRKRKSMLGKLEILKEEISSRGLDLFSEQDPDSDNWSVGWLLQLQYRQSKEVNKDDKFREFEGWFNKPSSNGIDYKTLERKLLIQDYEEADRLTSAYLRELSGNLAVDRGYVYFSEVTNISKVDLTTIDRLWVAYSQMKFGFSVQSRLLNSLGARYELLWPKIGWKVNGVWTRYPGSFTWDIKAPDGHMPLVNQLRGVRLMDTILKHPAIEDRRLNNI